MDRSAFGRWGAELPEGRFACAVAALGVIAGNRSRSRTPIRSSEKAIGLLRQVQGFPSPTPWCASSDWFAAGDSLPASATALADAWSKRLAEVNGIRLELSSDQPQRPPSPGRLAWYARLLAHPDVRARSVYVRADEPSIEVGWQWPLRIGFLRDERSGTLKTAIEAEVRAHPWLQPLATIVDAESADGLCDLLLLQGDLRGSLAQLAALPSPPTADCVVVVGDAYGSMEQRAGLIAGMRAAARTSGVAIAQLQAPRAARWYRELMRELSHAHPLDVALSTAARHESVGAPAPMIWASGRLMEVATLAHQLHRMAERLRDPRLASRSIDLSASPATRKIFRQTSYFPRSYGDLSYQLDDLASFARRNPGFEMFAHESGMATSAAELSNVASELSTGAADVAATRDIDASKAVARFIQARIFDGTAPQELVERRHALRAGAAHEIRVRIGRPSDDWGLTPRVPALSEDQLPRDADHHELTVSLVEPNLLPEGQSATIVLPKGGDSTEAHFWLFAPDESTQLDARIIVAHRNRILQTALLRAPIVSGDDRGEGTIQPEPEVVTRAALDDLAWRRPFDAALVANHSATGTSGVTAISDGEAKAFRVGDEMRRVLDEFDSALSKVATQRRKFEGGLHGAATVEMLRSFATLGALLHDHIVKDGLRNSALSKGERLQVISARADARLPVEFIYDRAAPAADALLCPHAEVALRRGACEASSCARGDAERSVICPLAFWGLSRVIERHAHDEDLVDRAVGHKDFAFRADPTSGRRTLNVLRGGMVGGSHQVTNTVTNGLTRICARISAAVHQPLDPLLDWESWKAEASNGNASLLVLLVHTEMLPGSSIMARMELGEESWLSLADLDEPYLGTDKGATPLVMLLGCETGAPEVPFASFVARCRHAKAPIVVVSGSLIHSIHAVPVAEEFVDALRDAMSRPEVTFGEVMRAVRRDMLAKGFPMVLALTAYGDADWRLAAESGAAS